MQLSLSDFTTSDSLSQSDSVSVMGRHMTRTQLQQASVWHVIFCEDSEWQYKGSFMRIYAVASACQWARRGSYHGIRAATLAGVDLLEKFH